MKLKGRKNEGGEEFVSGNYLLYYYSLEEKEDSAVPGLLLSILLNNFHWDYAFLPEIEAFA